MTGRKGQVGGESGTESQKSNYNIWLENVIHALKSFFYRPSQDDSSQCIM